MGRYVCKNSGGKRTCTLGLGWGTPHQCEKRKESPPHESFHIATACWVGCESDMIQCCWITWHFNTLAEAQCLKMRDCPLWLLHPFIQVFLNLSTTDKWGQIILCYGERSHSVCCRLFSSILGPDAPDTSSTPPPQLWQPKITSNIAKCCLGCKISLAWEPVTDRKNSTPIQMPGQSIH